jgi:uncharacterized membrane protein YfcA
MAKQIGGAFLDALQANWMYILGAVLAVIVLYYMFRSSSFKPKVKEGMGGCSKCPKSNK